MLTAEVSRGGFTRERQQDFLSVCKGCEGSLSKKEESRMNPWLLA